MCFRSRHIQMYLGQELQYKCLIAWVKPLFNQRQPQMVSLCLIGQKTDLTWTPDTIRIKKKMQDTRPIFQPSLQPGSTSNRLLWVQAWMILLKNYFQPFLCSLCFSVKNLPQNCTFYQELAFFKTFFCLFNSWCMLSAEGAMGSHSGRALARCDFSGQLSAAVQVATSGI